MNTIKKRKNENSKAEYEAGVADGLNTAKKDAAIAFAELHVPIEQIALALKVDVWNQ